MSRLRRFFNLWRGRSLERDFDDELEFHLAMRTDANLRRGMTPDDAAREARRHLGAPIRAKEGMREARVMMSLETLVRDVRYGVRLFGRQPGTTMLAVLMLSLGIGATAVVFSLVHAVTMRPLPFADPQRLVAIVDNFRGIGDVNVPPTIPELLDVRAATRTLERISFFDTRDVQINGGNEPARALAARVEADFLAILGVRPVLGRLFGPDEVVPGADRVVILTDAFWRRTFGSSAEIVGRSIVVNGVPSVVVGVLPPEFSFDYFSPEAIELYVPYSMTPAYTSRSDQFSGVRRVTAIGRIKTGLSIGQVSAELEAISRSIAAAHPQLYRRGSDGLEVGFAMAAEPLQHIVAGRGRSLVLLLFAAIVLVLLIACVNTAQFLLARAAQRQPEVAMRLALGASRGRLARQFLTESLLLAGVAALLALVQASWLTDGLRAMLAPHSPFVQSMQIDVPVVLFTTAVGCLATVVFGLAPALQFSRVSAAGGANLRAAGVVRARTRQVLIAVQIAVPMVLLVGTGLLVHAIVGLQNAPRGYTDDNVTVMQMRIAGRAAGPAIGAVYRQYLERIAAVPGVAAAAMADAPLPGSAGVEFSIAGRADDAATMAQQRASWRIVSPDYFNVLGIPLISGRWFANDDAMDRPAAAVINEEMARRFWPDADPIGAQVHSGVGPREGLATIVGVVGDVRPPLQTDVAPQIYASYLQHSSPNITLLVRSAAGAAVSPDAIKQAIWSVVPEQPVFDIRPMTDVAARVMTGPRTVAQLLGGFAVLAMFISTMGVYTVVSYLTARRTKEVALRRAIGATTRDVLALLGGDTMRWTLVGLALGIGGALAATSALRTVVLGAARVEATTVFALAVLYVVVVAVAVYIPAARALRANAATVLRAE